MYQITIEASGGVLTIVGATGIVPDGTYILNGNPAPVGMEGVESVTINTPSGIFSGSMTLAGSLPKAQKSDFIRLRAQAADNVLQVVTDPVSVTPEEFLA